MRLMSKLLEVKVTWELEKLLPKLFQSLESRRPTFTFDMHKGLERLLNGTKQSMIKVGKHLETFGNIQKLFESFKLKRLENSKIRT